MTESETLKRLFPWVRDERTDQLASELDVSHVVSAVLSSRRHVVLGALFDGVPSRTALKDLSLGTRIDNLLAARGDERFEVIAGESLDDIAGWRNVGTGSLEDLVRGLVSASLYIVELPDAFAEPAPFGLAESPLWANSVIDDLLAIAGWRRLLGTEGAPLLAGADAHAEPQEIRAARARLLALSAEDVLPEREDVGAAASLVQRALDGLDERQVDIVRSRIVADQPATLDELGERHDVSRERIRQIEAKLTPSLRARIHSGSLGALAEAARDAIGVVLPLRALLQRLPTLGELVPDLNQPVWRVLDRLDDAYEIDDGWCAPGSIREAFARTREIIGAASTNGRFVALDAIDGEIDLSEEWLTYASIPTLNGHALLGRASIPDRAEVILHSVQEPVSTADLHGRLGVDRSVTALKNALSTDARFDRVDRDRWALSAWGLDGYAPIHMLIGRALDTSGGTAVLADLVADLTARFAISASSVVAYASGFPYTTERGLVRRRTRRDMRNRARGRGLADTKGLFRFPSEIRLRVVVTGEHLRGSGGPLPNAIGEELDLGIGETRELISPTGGIQLSRPRAQIQLGSVRSQAMRLGLGEGDTVFFVFDEGGSFRIDRLSTNSDAVSRIAALAGGPLNEADLLTALADRIDAEEATEDSIVRALTSRGDAEIVELLQQSR